MGEKPEVDVIGWVPTVNPWRTRLLCLLLFAIMTILAACGSNAVQIEAPTEQPPTQAVQPSPTVTPPTNTPKPTATHTVVPTLVHYDAEQMYMNFGTITFGLKPLHLCYEPGAYDAIALHVSYPGCQIYGTIVTDVSGVRDDQVRVYDDLGQCGRSIAVNNLLPHQKIMLTASVAFDEGIEPVDITANLGLAGDIKEVSCR